MNQNRVIIFDTTLRDGEQAAGCRLGASEKLVIAQQLALLNVDIIEAGFPISSPEDFKSVKLIAENVEGPVICGLTRAVPEDIEVCGKALINAKKGRIHTGIGVSDIHLTKKLRLTKEEAIKKSAEAVRIARNFVQDVEFYAEDASRAEPGFLIDIVNMVIENGATVINIPDTTGYAIPELYGQLIRRIKNDVPAIRDNKVVLSVHCHNDLGLAVANTLAALANGARQVEGTINGIGERAGNTSLEEVIMALRTRKDYFGELYTDINAGEIYKTSQMVSHYLGIEIAPNKPIVGANAFAHSSGIHVDGVIKERTTYEIMNPEEIGVPKSKIILTARTGRNGLAHRLKELGFSFTNEQLENYYNRFLDVADRKTEVYDDDLVAIVDDRLSFRGAIYVLENLQSFSSTEIDGHAALVKINKKDEDKPLIGKAWGNGPVNAAYKAVNRALGYDIQLSDYKIKAVTKGSEAMGEVQVKIRYGEIVMIGHGSSLDVIEASVKAYLNGINKIAEIIDQKNNMNGTGEGK